MSVGNLLFSPKGRIGPSDLWKGLIILLILQVLITVISAFSPMALTMLLGIVSIALLYPFVCVLGKRLHDNGKSAWWVILVIVAYLVVSWILTFLLLSVFGLNPMTAGANPEAMAAYRQSSLLPSILGAIVMTAILGFIMATLKSEPGTNKYGPPPGGDTSTGPDEPTAV